MPQTQRNDSPHTAPVSTSHLFQCSPLKGPEPIQVFCEPLLIYPKLPGADPRSFGATPPPKVPHKHREIGPPVPDHSASHLFQATAPQSTCRFGLLSPSPAVHDRPRATFSWHALEPSPPLSPYGESCRQYPREEVCELTLDPSSHAHHAIPRIRIKRLTRNSSRTVRGQKYPRRT